MIKASNEHRWGVPLVLLAVAVSLAGCGADPSGGEPGDDPGDTTLGALPPLLEPFCSAAGGGAYDCEDQPITLKAFVDLINLPGVRLVSTTDDYGDGREMLPVLHPDGSLEELTHGYAEDLDERLAGPAIKGEVLDGTIRKVMQPGNGVMIATWHVEIQSSDMMRYFTVLPGGGEEPIER